MSDLVFVKPANDNPALTLARWGAAIERRASPNGHHSRDANRVLLYLCADWDRRHLALLGQATAILP